MDARLVTVGALVALVAGRAVVRTAAGSKSEGVDLPTTTSLLQVKLEMVLDALWALQRLYPTLHWQAQGATSYSDHLLFERLYGEVQKDLDRVGERLVGLYGSSSVKSEKATARSVNLIEQWMSGGRSPSDQAIFAEKEMMRFLNLAVSAPTLDAGTQNLLQDLLDRHLSNLYLLQQRSGGLDPKGSSLKTGLPAMKGPVDIYARYVSDRSTHSWEVEVVRGRNRIGRLVFPFSVGREWDFWDMLREAAKILEIPAMVPSVDTLGAEYKAKKNTNWNIRKDVDLPSDWSPSQVHPTSPVTWRTF